MAWIADKAERRRRLAICAGCPEAVLTVAVAWLEKRLEKLEPGLAADTAPGRAPGRHDRHRILER